MARITALAKAMQATGNGGQIDFVRAQVFLGLLLGTLPYIPPSPDAPPDDPPPDDPPPDDPPPDAPPREGRGQTSRHVDLVGTTGHDVRLWRRFRRRESWSLNPAEDHDEHARRR